MERISVRRKQLHWWHSSKHCIRQIKSQHATPLKPWRSAQARSLHGKPSHVRVPCPRAGVVAPVRRPHHTGGGRGRGLFSRLAFSSKCFSQPNSGLAARCVYGWSGLGVDCGRVSARRTRSSVTHDSHAEAPSVDDDCGSAGSSGSACVSNGVRITEALHYERCPQAASTMARTLSYASWVVLAGGNGGRNRMASSRCVSVG